MSELLQIAVQIVVLSFRAGLLATETTERIYLHPPKDESSCAHMYPRLPIDRANTLIKAFAETHVSCEEQDLIWLLLLSRDYLSRLVHT